MMWTDGTAGPKVPTDDVTCADCIAVAQAEADDGIGALSAEGMLGRKPSEP